MGQRVMIAMMLIPEPDLLIADEPTSALDVSVQAQVLDIIDELVRRTGMGLIFISHDLNLVVELLRPHPGDARRRSRRGMRGRRARQCEASLHARADRGDPAHRRDARRAAGARPRRMGGMSAIAIANLDVSYGQSRITHGIGFDVGRRRELCAGRRKRLGQVHGAEGHRRARQGMERHDLGVRQAAHPRHRPRLRAAVPDGVPGPLRLAASAQDHRRHAERAAGHPRHRRRGKAGRGDDGGGRARPPLPLPLSAPAFRRPAPARRHRARA